MPPESQILPDPRIALIRDCSERGPAEPGSGRPEPPVFEVASCRSGRGATPGLVTLRDCLDCAAGAGPEGRRSRFRKDVLIRTALTSWTGYGQIGEWLGRGLEWLGLEVGFADTGTDSRYLPTSRWVAERSVPPNAAAAWSILLAPPDQAHPAGRAVRFTMWESTRIGRSAAACLNRAELVCVPCEANRLWLRESGVTAPVAIVPMGVSPVEGYRDDGTPPPRDVCRFGMAARMAHGGARKGLNEGMEAFAAAFPPRVDDVELVLKVWPDCVGRLRVPADRRIRVVTAPMRPPEMAAWYRTLTALLVPSKGEGWGLHTHQAMAVGRPVIAAPWGGTAEFWDERCGWPLEFDMAPAGDFYDGQGDWAVPRHESIVERLRQVHADRAEAAARGRIAATRAAEFTWERTARCLHRALLDSGFVSAAAAPQTPTIPVGTKVDAQVDPSGESQSRRGASPDARSAPGPAVTARECEGRIDTPDRPGSAGPVPISAAICRDPGLEIPLVIMTASRPEAYLGRTLASLAPRRPITLMVGTPEAGHLQEYRGNPLFRIVEPTPEEYARVAGTGVHEHAAWNYWRCLGAGEGGRRLLIFEDDVRFASGWEARLAALLGRIERDHADYILSLYYPYPGEEDGGAGFVAYPKGRFFGTQGVLFAGRARSGFRSYLFDRGVEPWTMPYDWLLRDYAEEGGAPLFAAMPSLVQHTGAVTTGQSAWFHTSACFADDVEGRGRDLSGRMTPAGSPEPDPAG